VDLPKEIEEAVSSLSKLPGIGPKTALRKVLTMTNWQEDQLLALADSLKSLTNLKKCNECGFFASNFECDICQNETRKSSNSICIVETVIDCIAVENTDAYNGLYFVLGGVLNPLLGIGPEELGIEKLLRRVKVLDISEVILALNPSVEGDATCSYIKQILPVSVKVDRIGFGIPIGGCLEYVDSVTIATALENRKHLN